MPTHDLQLPDATVREIHRRAARQELCRTLMLWVPLLGGMVGVIGLFVTGRLVGGALGLALGLALVAWIGWQNRPAVASERGRELARERGTGPAAATTLQIGPEGVEIRRAGELLELRPGAFALVPVGGWIELKPDAWPVVWAWLAPEDPALGALEALATSPGPVPPFASTCTGWGAFQGRLDLEAKRALQRATGAQPPRMRWVLGGGLIVLIGLVGLLFGGGLRSLALVGLGLGMGLLLTMNAWLVPLYHLLFPDRGAPVHQSFGPEGVCALGPGVRTRSPWACFHRLERDAHFLMLEGPRGWVLVDTRQDIDADAIVDAWRRAREALQSPQDAVAPRPPAAPEPADPNPYRPPRQA